MGEVQLYQDVGATPLWLPLLRIIYPRRRKERLLWFWMMISLLFQHSQRYSPIMYGCFVIGY